MTTITYTPAFDASIIGPYSAWPRARRTLPRRRIAALAAGTAGISVFLHCIAPMLIAA